MRAKSPVDDDGIWRSTAAATPWNTATGGWWLQCGRCALQPASSRPICLRAAPVTSCSDGATARTIRLTPYSAWNDRSISRAGKPELLEVLAADPLIDF